MKKLFALVALVLGVVSCQKDHAGMDVNMGGEQEVMINVSLPEETRANSAVSDITNLVASDEYTIRYIFQVYNANETVSKTPVYQYTDAKTASFPVRLVPGRDYRFVVWADIVNQNTKADLHYITTAFPEISLNATWAAMDETRDAYTVSELVEDFDSRKAITLTLKRPLAKLRVITTDIKELLGLTPESATVTYTTKHYNAFNALSSVFAGEISAAHTYSIAAYDDNTETDWVLFTDYFFANDEVVKFNMSVNMSDGEAVERSFTTDIPVKRNYLTTIKGDILTDGNNIVVNVEEGFENAGNIEDAPYHQVAVTSGVGLIKALMQGREIIVLNDIKVTSADLVEATRAAAAVYPVINLNGFTITIETNDDEAHLVNLNGGTLTVEGEGSIVSENGALVEGTTVVTEGATVEAEAAVDENGNSTVKTGIEALAYVLANGGEFTFTENIAISEVLLASTTNPIVINGADFTLTSAATRAIRATVANANIVVNDLNIVVTTERVGSNDIRGISVDNVTGVELTLNNCSVIFSHPSGNDWAYAVNVTGGSNHKVTVNGGTYNGANVINVRGSENTVIVKNATLTSLYPNDDVYYGACIYVVQHENSSVYAEGNTFNGDNALAFNIGYTPIEEKNNTNNAKRVAAKVNGAYYYNIAEAIAAAEDGATVKVLQNHDCNVGATVPVGKTLTIDLNGKTVKGTDTITGSFGLITNKGNLTITGNGKMTLKAENNRGWNAYSSVLSNNPGGNLVVENATIEHLGGTDMAYGIDNLTNGKGTYAETTVNNGAVIKSCYRAIRQFLNGIEAQNILTVNAGAVVEGANKSIWMQDPSAKANTGKLVVNEGATLNGDVYLFVTAGSTEWPVEVSIAASAVNGEVLTGNVPAGYAVKNINGTWEVLKYTVVNTPAAIRSEVAKDNAVVYIENGDYKLEGKLSFGKNVIILGNGASLFNDWGSNAFGNQAHFTNTYVENINFTNNLIIDAGIVTGDVKFVNCVFGGNLAHQGVHFDSGNGTLTFDDCTFVGRNMLGASIEKVVFNNCYFENKRSSLTGADKWTGVNMWGKYEFNNCVFGSEAHCNVKCDGVVATFTGCTYTNGEAISEEIINGTEANIAGSTITIK